MHFLRRPPTIFIIKKTMTQNKEYVTCCNDCGSKRYVIIRNAGAITMTMDECKLCGKQKPLIPASDWAYMSGDNLMWD